MFLAETQSTQRDQGFKGLRPRPENGLNLFLFDFPLKNQTQLRVSATSSEAGEIKKAFYFFTAEGCQHNALVRVRSCVSVAKNESGQVSAASSAIARLRIDTSRHGYYYGHKNKQ
jgi:hypothetical protein